VIEADRLDADLYFARRRRWRRSNVAKFELAIADKHKRAH
jgi:hypothetical protein